MLSSEKHSPRYSSRVLSLKKEGFGLAILESEDLAVTSDIELALHTRPSVFILEVLQTPAIRSRSCAHSTRNARRMTDLARVDLGARKGVVVGTHVDGVCGSCIMWVIDC